MPDTSRQYFGSVTQTSTGAETWQDLNNVLDTAGWAFGTNLVGNSEYIILSNPLAESEVPAGKIIDAIEIRILADREDILDFTCAFTDALITDGSVKTNGDDIGPTQTLRIYSGNLSYWGLSQAEAEAFIRDTGGNFRFRADATGPSAGDMFCYWVDCMISYSDVPPPVDPQVNVPVMF